MVYISVGLLSLELLSVSSLTTRCVPGRTASDGGPLE